MKLPRELRECVLRRLEVLQLLYQVLGTLYCRNLVPALI